MQTLTQQMVDEIFSFSELGFQEHETSKYVKGILEKNGFHVERGVAGVPTAWIATYGSGKPVIAGLSRISIAYRGRRRNREWRITIRLSRERRGTERGTTRGWR